MSLSAIEAFRDELKRFDTSKGTIRFPLDKPLPASLVKRIVRLRLVQNEEKEQKKRR